MLPSNPELDIPLFLAQEFCQVEKPSMRRKLWMFLGFGIRASPSLKDAHGMAPGYLLIRMVGTVHWRDRLRLLVTGKFVLESAVQTDVTIQRINCRHVFSVPFPGADL